MGTGASDAGDGCGWSTWGCSLPSRFHWPSNRSSRSTSSLGWRSSGLSSLTSSNVEGHRPIWPGGLSGPDKTLKSLI